MKMSLIKAAWKRQFPGQTSVFFWLLTDLSALVLIYFMSKSFDLKKLDPTLSSLTYFDFIILGEIAFRVPAFVLNAFPKIVRRHFTQNTLLIHWQSNKHYFLQLFKELLPDLILQFVLLTFHIFIATTFLGLNFNLFDYFSFLWMTFLSLPVFIAFGLLAAILLLIVGRGEQLVSKCVSALIALSGTLFPIAVLPELLSSFIAQNPFYIFMSQVRLIQTNQNHLLINSDLIFLFTSGLFLTGLTFLLYNKQKKLHQKRHSFPKLI